MVESDCWPAEFSTLMAALPRNGSMLDDEEEIRNLVHTQRLTLKGNCVYSMVSNVSFLNVNPISGTAKRHSKSREGFRFWRLL